MIDPEQITLRPLALGDIGWITYRHAQVIAPEFGWNIAFEAMCAKILAEFVEQFQPDWEASWIAEVEGRIIGSLFLIRENETTARLRLLYIENEARGCGLATKLLNASFTFAKSRNYQRVILFTTGSNLDARRIYEKLDMQLIETRPMQFAGKAETGETWELKI